MFAVLARATRLSAQAVPTGATLNFTHIADGDTGNGFWTTDFSFVNDSPNTATGQLSLFDDNGLPFSLGTNQGTASTFNITIAPAGDFDIVTNGAGSAVGGWALATFDQAVMVSANYAFSTTAAGELVSVGVLSTYPVILFRSPASFKTGIAIVNTDSTVTDCVTIYAGDQNGNLAGSATLTLAPRQHVAKNLNQFIPTLPATFIGSVAILSANSRFIALAIGVKSNPNNSFVGYSLPSVTYPAAGSSSYSGTYSLISGPDAPAAGTCTLNGFGQFASDFVTATLTINFLGTTYTAPLLANADPFGLLVSSYFKVPQFPHTGRAVAQLQTDGSLTGFFADIGTGDSGTFALTPSP